MRIIQHGKVLFEEEYDEIVFEDKGTKRSVLEADLFLKEPDYLSDYYFDIVVEDCETGEELYYFAGMHDFSDSSPRITLPSELNPYD